MPVLTINAIGNNVALSDPFPTEGQMVVGAPVGTTKRFSLSLTQFERILPQLQALELMTMGDLANTPVMTWSIDLSGPDSREPFGSYANAPGFTYLAAANVSAGTPATGVVLNGVNFLQGQVQATATVGGCPLKAVLPGSAGNLITVAFVDPAAIDQSISVGVVGNAVTVTLATNHTGVITSTFNTVKSALAAHATAKYMVAGTSTASTVVTAATAKHLAGGAGAGITLTIGADTMKPTVVTNTAITFDTVALTGPGNGNLAMMTLLTGASNASMSVPIVT